MTCWCVISLRWCHIMVVHKCYAFCLKRKNILSPTPDACCPLLAVRSIQLMTGEPRPWYSALQLLVESGDCELNFRLIIAKLVHAHEKMLCLSTAVHYNTKWWYVSLQLFCVMKTGNNEFDLGQLLWQYWLIWLTKNCSFQQLSGKLSTQPTSNLVCTLIWQVFQNHSIWGNVAEFWSFSGQ